MSRIGNWRQTYTGRKYYPIDPRPEDVCIEDIAHHLSMLCRYGGATSKFYSVAEHSVIVSRFVPQEYALEGLLHDAAEAYIGDMVRPLKHEDTMIAFRNAETLNEMAVQAKFNLNLERACWDAIKLVDDRVIYDEVEALMPNAPEEWHRRMKVKPLGAAVEGYVPILAEALFLSRFYELILERQ